MNDLSWGRVGWVVAVVIGHFGLHIAIINRSGGLGLDYRLVKLFSRLVAVSSLVIPWWAAREIGSQFLTRSESMAVPIGWSVYGAVCLAVWVILGSLGCYRGRCWGSARWRRVGRLRWCGWCVAIRGVMR